MRTVPSRSTSRRVAAFTLTELLIVMGVIAALSVLTLVSMRAIVKDARLASATNTVTASLENARALAMKKNNIVLLVFRPRIEGNDKVVVDLVPCHWTGESYENAPTPAPPVASLVVDRFVPIPDAPVRTLPAGIKVAAPAYSDPTAADHVWATQSHLLATANGEIPGVVFGVMYAPDGTTISGNPQSDASLIWVDFFVDPDTGPLDPLADPKMRLGGDGTWYDLDAAPRVFGQVFGDDEPFVVIAPFLAVYDDDAARELGRVDQWNDEQVYQADLVGVPADPNPTIPSYITANAKRIHFNRYTGVVMK